MIAESLVQVYRRNVFGRILTYPANDTGAKLLVLTGQKSFTPDHLAAIELLGFEIVRIEDPAMTDEQPTGAGIA